MAVDYEARSLPYADEDTLNISQVILGQQIYEGAWTPPTHTHVQPINPIQYHYTPQSRWGKK